MKAVTALRIAMYANLVVILLAPAPFVVVAFGAQMGIMVALFYLRRRQRLGRQD